MQTQGVISLIEAQVEKLFGKLGTHSKCAGATFWLRDAFFSDSLGRKVTVLAPSRAVATAALRTLLYQLSRTHGADDALVNTSQWNYIDRKGVQHGPYAFRSMLRWAERNAFHTDALPIQHDTLKCWLPLWFLPQLTQLLTSQAALGPEEVVMQDWEAAVAEVNAERSGHGILHATPSLTQGRAAGGTGLAEFPELYDSAAAPMDYEVSAITSSAAPDSCRVLVVVDTNILLSHFSFVERAFEHLTQGAPLLEVLLLVPWVVLNELDRLKDGRAKVQSGSARLALRRVRALTADRDAYMRVQTAAEHAKAVAEEPLPDASSRELRNDDFILQTSLYWRREMADALMYAGHRAAVFLLTNDRGLCVRAEANGIRCFTAAEFPVVPETLAAEVPDALPVDMDESESYRLPEDTAAGLSLHSAEVEQQQQHRSDLHQAHREQDPLTGMPAGTAAAANGIRNVADRHDARDRELVASAREPATQNTAPAALLAPAAEVSGAGDEADSQGVAVDDSELLMSVVERFLGPGIKYFRQQDLGDLWVEMLAPELRPPWGAVEVLAVLDRHSTTFWEVLSRGQLNNARSVQRTVRSWARGGRSVRSDEVRDPARKLQDIMQSLLVAMDKPGLGSQAPNPAEVPDFVSLGDARAALQRGIKEIEQLLGSYRVSRGGMGAEGSGGRCQAPERYR